MASNSAKINRALADGVGGLQFQAQSPPGLGRLIRIPFYMDQANFAGFHSLTPALAIPAGGLSATTSDASTTHPIIGFRAPNNAAAATVVFASAEPSLHTPQISWATLRIVGFEATVYRQINLVRDPYPGLAFRDLKVGGGATLFVHEDYGPSDIYLMGQDSFAGLRDYPVLKSPNVAEVICQYSGTATTLAGPVQVILQSMYSANLVCEVLLDDNYGAHIPGPYARSGALVRQGGAQIAQR